MLTEDSITRVTPWAERSVPLFGRTAELDRLRALVSGSAEPGGALLVSGEAGVGKSALLTAAHGAARDEGFTVLSATGVEFLADLGGSTLRQALTPLHHLSSLLGAAQRDALEEVWSRPRTPPDPVRVLCAVLALLRSAAAERPVLVIVDDLQWADRASATTFALAARRLVGSRVGFLAAVRTGGAGVFDRARVPELELAPLDELASARLLHSRFPRLAPRVARRVLAEADGNAAALSELPAALTEAQRSGVRPLPAVLPLGPGLRAFHGPRVAGLPASTRWALLLAALESTGDLMPVAAASGGLGLDPLAPAERAGLVTVDPGARRLAFRHPLVRSTVVDGASRAERRRAHRALAAGLTHDVEGRARHLAEAAGTPDEDTARLVERAAHRVLHRGDGIGAVDHLLRAVDLSATGRERGRRLAEAAWVGASVTGDLERLGPLLAEVDRCDPGGAGLPAVVAAAWRLLHGDGDGDVAGAHRLVLDALGAEPDGDGAASDAVDEAMHIALEACLVGGRAEQWEALRATGARRDLSPDLALLVTLLSAPTTVTSSDLERLDQAIRRSWSEPSPVRVLRIATAALVLDRGSECRAVLWGLVESGRRGDAITSAIRALTLLCADDFVTGRWDECVHLAQEGIEMSTNRGYRLLAHPLRLVSALVAAARGDAGTTAALVAAVAAWAGPRGHGALADGAHQVSALAALADADPERAYEHAMAAGPAGTLPPFGLPALAVGMDLVEAARRTGRDAEAVRHARAVRDAPDAARSPRQAMVAAGAQAVALSPADAAADLFEEALSVPGGERWAFDHARIQLAYGAHLRRRRDTDAACRHLRDALAAFRRLSARPWAARARDELRAVGSRPEVVRGPDDPAPLLTREEHEVASLAASGLTNKQIGLRLHLSHRTVSARLYRTFPKLGVTSRAGLRDALGATGAGERPDR